MAFFGFFFAFTAGGSTSISGMFSATIALAAARATSRVWTPRSMYGREAARSSGGRSCTWETRFAIAPMWRVAGSIAWGSVTPRLSAAVAVYLAGPSKGIV